MEEKEKAKRRVKRTTNQRKNVLTARKKVIYERSADDSKLMKRKMKNCQLPTVPRRKRKKEI